MKILNKMYEKLSEQSKIHFHPGIFINEFRFAENKLAFLASRISLLLSTITSIFAWIPIVAISNKHIVGFDFLRLKKKKEASLGIIMKKLNLGCGKDYKKDCINVDILDNVKVDVKHDLNVYPYPFDDDEFDLVYCIDIIEHLEKPMKTMEEIHRISKKGAKIIIRTPHFSSQYAYADLSHVHSFSARVFDEFTGKTKWSYQTKVVYNILTKKILFSKGKYFWNYFIEPLINLSDLTRNVYETTFLYLFPATNVYFELEVVK